MRDYATWSGLLAGVTGVATGTETAIIVGVIIASFVGMFFIKLRKKK